MGKKKEKEKKGRLKKLACLGDSNPDLWNWKTVLYSTRTTSVIARAIYTPSLR